VQSVARRFLVDLDKPFRQKPDLGLGCERFYLTPPRLLEGEELPSKWGLLEVHGRKVEIIRKSARNLRTFAGFGYEMNLLLASLRRVEIRIEAAIDYRLSQVEKSHAAIQRRLVSIRHGAHRAERNCFWKVWFPNPNQPLLQKTQRVKLLSAPQTPSKRENRAGWPGFSLHHGEMGSHHDA